ncbi:MAG: GtrA family protein [Roseiflexaceae bacterium]
MNTVTVHKRQIPSFVLFSGLGWLCDITTYSFLIYFINIPHNYANGISSFVGVTFVWFTSLRFTFNASSGKSSLLVVYWIYQSISIMLYSYLILLISDYVSQFNICILICNLDGILAKISVTPINLITNYLFMNIIVRLMKLRGK